jgi:hypothetical protein
LGFLFGSIFQQSSIAGDVLLFIAYDPVETRSWAINAGQPPEEIKTPGGWVALLSEWSISFFSNRFGIDEKR